MNPSRGSINAWIIPTRHIMVSFPTHLALELRNLGFSTSPFSASAW